MKKIFTLIAVIALCYQANSQTVIQNGSFETWNSFNSKNYPDKWEFDSFEVSNGAVQKVSPGSDGSNAMRLGCYLDAGTVYGALIEKFDTVTVVPGTLSFDYKMFNAPGFLNGLYIQIYFYDDNNFLKKFDFSAETNNSAFKTGVINIGFGAGEVPTYYRLEVSYFNAGGSTSEYTIVDNFRFGKAASSISSQSVAPAINIWPNPASGMLYFSNLDLNTVKVVRFISMDGRNTSLVIENSSVDISSFSKGVYIIEVIDNNNKMIKREKIAIKD